MCPPGNGYALQARFRSGRSIAVHRAAKDAAQVPMLLYGLSGIPIPRLVSSHDPSTAVEGDRKGAPLSFSFEILHMLGRLFPACASRENSGALFRTPFCAGVWVTEVTSEQGLEKVKIRGYALSLAMGLSDRRELPIAKLCI